MIELRTIDSSLAVAFRTLLPQPQQPLLLQMPPNTVAWGALEDGQPVALALAVPRANTPLADLVAVSVAPSVRRRGIGSRLLAEVESRLRDLGCQRLIVEMLLETTEVRQADHFLRKNGFPPSEVALFVFSGDISRVKELRWFRNIKLSADFSLFPWRELRRAEREEIERGLDVWYPASLSPFQEEELLDPNHSVGLRYQNEVIGWLTTQRLAQNMILYKSMFVKQEFQRMGRGIAMTIEMVRQTQLVQEVPFGTIIIEQGNDAMLQIVRRRFAPLIQREKVLRRTNKAI